jgi:hypothetical protein
LQRLELLTIYNTTDGQHMAAPQFGHLAMLKRVSRGGRSSLRMNSRRVTQSERRPWIDPAVTLVDIAADEP